MKSTQITKSSKFKIFKAKLIGLGETLWMFFTIIPCFNKMNSNSEERLQRIWHYTVLHTVYGWPNSVRPRHKIILGHDTMCTGLLQKKISRNGSFTSAKMAPFCEFQRMDSSGAPDATFLQPRWVRQSSARFLLFSWQTACWIQKKLILNQLDSRVERNWPRNVVPVTLFPCIKRRYQASLIGCLSWKSIIMNIFGTQLFS